ncbi:hypothetical protein [Faecalibaculum rodentium]|jgi:hypothetical protein|uniref:hypothetical protein n=2 Tax=Faecalibaculum rodentium TaxID=1702221 RepID=UPI0024906A81|nr:hypothetical protein [Faecalibaculum rodentium]
MDPAYEMIFSLLTSLRFTNNDSETYFWKHLSGLIPDDPAREAACYMLINLPHFEDLLTKWIDQEVFPDLGELRKLPEYKSLDRDQKLMAEAALSLLAGKGGPDYTELLGISNDTLREVFLGAMRIATIRSTLKQVARKKKVD